MFRADDPHGPTAPSGAAPTQRSGVTPAAGGGRLRAAGDEPRTPSGLRLSEWQKLNHRLFMEHRQPIFDIAKYSGAESPEDVVQEVFLIAGKFTFSKPLPENPGEVRALLATFACRLVSSEHRAAYRRRRDRVDVESLGDTRATSEQGFDVTRWRHALDGALARLPRKDRALIEAVLDGSSPKEIAQKMNAKESTVRTWLTRSRALLRNIFLGGQDEDGGDGS